MLLSPIFIWLRLFSGLVPANVRRTPLILPLVMRVRSPWYAKYWAPYKPLRLRLTIQQSDSWPFRSLSIRMPKSEKKWIGVKSYGLCARKGGRFACLLAFATSASVFFVIWHKWVKLLSACCDFQRKKYARIYYFLVSFRMFICVPYFDLRVFPLRVKF